MKEIKVELLAPAGDFQCFQAAINAGADAVYLGGEKFGARAYANNFTEKEIINALRIAHLFGKKIYLTVNTLVKEKEIEQLVPYIVPLYEAGLDGVIVQDIGVFEILKKNFPGLELHASTQMTITGVYGAKFLKELGASRIVPARELSLEEIRYIHDETGIEIEAFIHGAMCYGYSGQCLFSSIIGGRSGNRGRCAGPCRLPYTDEKGKTIYPLSLKDMYTLPMIPKLIDAGIYSFKIEGRMKSPEYVAGVTAIYRKYIDEYIRNPDKPYIIDKNDEEILKNLYIRTDICNGYYNRHNDKTMVTIKEPGYSGSSQEIIDTIRHKYIENKKLIDIDGYVKIKSGEKAELILTKDEYSVSVEGDVVSEAMNRPLSKDEISKRINKMGDTFFTLRNLDIDTDNSSFMPVKALNEMRREACQKLEDAIISKREILINGLEKTVSDSKKVMDVETTNRMTVLVSTYEQLNFLLSFEVNSITDIYINSDIFISAKNTDDILNKLKKSTKSFLLVLPHILRKRSYKYLDKYWELLGSGVFTGVLVRNHEEYFWLKEKGYTGRICADYTIYSWNKEAEKFYSEIFDRITMSLELNRKEILQLSAKSNREMLIYGYIPLMYSANCVRKTLGRCINDVSGSQNIYSLTDRYKNSFKILQNCLHCYNELYNAIPLSLHGSLHDIFKEGYGALRLDFTIESTNEMKDIICFYSSLFEGKSADSRQFPLKNFTNGHYKRGVE
ncbi:MAG: U32 family peptidase [Lachnospiraceae bacterium]|nr:U32 family peptidase [Lachnospiraceae bacterium]